MPKTVAITGASRGLGFYIAQNHLALGHRVYALDVRDRAALQAAVVVGARPENKGVVS